MRTPKINSIENDEKKLNFRQKWRIFDMNIPEYMTPLAELLINSRTLYFLLNSRVSRFINLNFSLCISLSELYPSSEPDSLDGDRFAISDFPRKVIISEWIRSNWNCFELVLLGNLIGSEKAGASFKKLIALERHFRRKVKLQMRSSLATHLAATFRVVTWTNNDRLAVKVKFSFP